MKNIFYFYFVIHGFPCIYIIILDDINSLKSFIIVILFDNHILYYIKYTDLI
jgi:hypothetical protein